MDKRDRAQKLKRDKRNKDSKRGHDQSNKSENKPSNVTVLKPQAGSTKDQKSDAKTTPNKEPVGGVIEDPSIQFANLKRETDEINQLNKTYSKRQVTSNWSKYETPLPPEEDEVVSKGADFESLLRAPISEGGHFKFKSEQMWSQSPLQFSDIFSLDVKHLARSLSRVPFYEQVGLSKELFSKELLEQMDKEAKQNSDRYTPSLDEPLVNNFYEVLKSSLVETSIQKTADEKLKIRTESVGEKSTENIRVIDSFVDKQMDDVQPVQSLQHNTDLDSSSETHEIILRPKKDANDMILKKPKREEKDTTLRKPETEENDTTFMKDSGVGSVSQVITPQISVESKPSDSLENKVISKKTDAPVKTNDVSKTSEVLSNNVSSETSPQATDTTVKQNSSTIEDDDELDFLLTLKQPVSGPKYVAKLPTKPVPVDDILGDDLGALSLSSTTETKEDLEDWLDSMLTD